MKLYIPSREKIDNLKVGDKMLNCFGEWAKVTEINYKGKRVSDEAHFACVSLSFNSGSTISHSYVEGELVRTVELSNCFTSCAVDDIERQMKAQRVYHFDGSEEDVYDNFLPF